MNLHLQYILQIADNALILGQRLSEWCGHGPILEDDIALTNIALDQIGLARLLFQYAAEVREGELTEDDMAFLRDSWQYANVLLAELENRDFAYTIMRQFIFDSFHIHFFKELTESKDHRLSEIAQKTVKEVRYHFRYSSVWIKRLGDGTKTSHQRIQEALNHFWPYTGEMVTESDADTEMKIQGIAPDLEMIRPEYYRTMKEVLTEATLTIPPDIVQHTGGKQGVHTEQLGYLLADLQYMQRTYPNNGW